MNSIPVLETLARDARYAWRVLRRSPAFTLAAILTLAIAVAVNTAVFSVVDAVLLEPLPYPDPDRLALVSRTVTDGGPSGISTSVDGRTWEAVRDGVPSARRAVFSTWTTGVNLATAVDAGRAEARHVQQQRVGAGFFATLGVLPAIGREFSSDEDRPGGPPAVVLGYDLWHSTFAADPAILGRPIVLRGAPHTVVGVMPPGFATGARADLWTPLRPSTAGEGAGENYHVILRLADGATWPQLEEELSRVGARVRAEAPRTPSSPVVTFGARPLQEAITADLRQPLLILWAAVGIVLVIAAVNLAGLLLARGSGRRREIATRIALGSGRSAVVRQLVVESAVLGALGAIAGAALAALLLDGLIWLARDSFDLWQSASVNGRSLAVALALSAVASIAFGLVPALQASRLDVQSGLRLGGSRGVAGGGSPWPRRAIVVAQVALGVVLLVSAGLLVRTFAHLRGLEPGFDPANVLTASVSLEDDRYQTSAAIARLFDTTLARVRESPGIDAAAVALEMPYRRLLNLGFRPADGPQAAQESGATTSAAYVSEDFFDALRMPLRRGRAFTAADRAGSPPVAIVNDAFARMYLDGGSAVGRTIRIAGAVREIVGQSGDVPVRPGWGSFGPLAPMPTVYLPYGQVPEATLRLVHGWFSPTFIVRADSAASAASALRRAVDAVDPMLPFAAVRPINDVRDASLAPQRFLMSLLVALAAAAVALAAVGIHGLIATTVSERTREMGVRMALGATRARAVRTVAAPGVLLAAAGVVIGLGAAWAAAGTMKAFVWGISTNDPATFGAVGGIILLIASLASVLPALRILRLDPAATLRAE